MALPELYKHPRQGEYFGLKLFMIYMTDAVVQVRHFLRPSLPTMLIFLQSVVIFFLLLYTYITISSRSDGFAVYQFEFSTTMAIATVMIATLFNGLNTIAWTAWVFWVLGIEIVLIWLYTVRVTFLVCLAIS